MISKKKELGQYFTTNSNYIIGNLINIISDGYKVIDPFAGNWDLLNLFKNINVEKYGFDIEPKNAWTTEQDTLKFPLAYNGYWVVTNPPYLARNKTSDKEIFNIYNTDDLYKIALLSISTCEGGIIIVPLNFLSSKDDSIRKKFLSNFKIIKLNIFEEQVFSDTSYTICSFSFVRHKNECQNICMTFYPSEATLTCDINYSEGYRIGSEFYSMLATQTNIKISRLLVNELPSSKIFLRAIDTGSLDGRISLNWNDKPFFGKNTDRAFATISFSVLFADEQQLFIIEQFNNILEIMREKYHSMFLSSFRNSTDKYSRKRLSFDDAYGLIRFIIKSNSMDLI